MLQAAKEQYFTEFTNVKLFSYLVVLIYVLLCCCVFVAEPFLSTPECTIISQNVISTPNPLYNVNLCRNYRYIQLLFLTRDECSFGRRLVSSVIYGGIIGWERRQSDRPAGIRTMSLVSLGSCLFTITSAFNFLDGPMAWDASRIAAAIPSGVGFLGAGLIFKDTQTNKKTGATSNVVHGLTTSASLWISAAVGVACAGELYFCANFSVALILTLLRFGPRQPPIHHDDDDDEDHHDTTEKDCNRQHPVDDHNEENVSPPDKEYGALATRRSIDEFQIQKEMSVRTLKGLAGITESERSRLLKYNPSTKSQRPRATLAGDM